MHQNLVYRPDLPSQFQERRRGPRAAPVDNASPILPECSGAHRTELSFLRERAPALRVPVRRSARHLANSPKGRSVRFLFVLLAAYQKSQLFRSRPPKTRMLVRPRPPCTALEKSTVVKSRPPPRKPPGARMGWVGRQVLG